MRCRQTRWHGRRLWPAAGLVLALAGLAAAQENGDPDAMVSIPVAAPATPPADKDETGTTRDLVKEVWRDSTSPLTDAPAKPSPSGKPAAPAAAAPVVKAPGLPARPARPAATSAAPATTPPKAMLSKPTTSQGPVRMAPATTAPTTRPAAATTRPGAPHPIWPKRRPARALADAAREARKRPVINPDVLARIRQGTTLDLQDPMALADVLFEQTEYASALALYEVARKRPAESDARAWVLFQIGNCQRHLDAAAAKAAYEQLIKEHPKSLWVPVARVRLKLLEWTTMNDPKKLLAKVAGSPDS